MSRRHFSFLAVAALLVVGLAILLLPSRTARESIPERAAVLPGLAEWINDAERLTVTGAGGEVRASLERDGTLWRVEELSGYPADFDRVREVLAGLATAEIIENKTANPDYHARLGVEDVAAADAQGLLVLVSSGERQGAVILGEEATGRNGRYLRVAGQEQSVLADFEAEVPADALGWTDDSLVDLPAATVAEVIIEHPDGERLRVSKVSADDTDFAVEGGLPEGRELVSSWSVNSLGGVFAGLAFEDVRPGDDLDWSGATRVRALAFSGLALEAELVPADGRQWLRLQAAAPGDAADAGEEPESEPEADQDQATVTDPASEARDINERTAGWAYAIADFKAENLGKRLEDLLKPLDESTEQP
jgi:hypothetical protein